MREMRALQKLQDGLSVELVGDSLYQWVAVLSGGSFPEDCRLRAQLDELRRRGGAGDVVFDISFPKTYPFLPPFVRVVRPRFKFHTGHVTIGGSLCMELLTPKGWNPAYSFETVMVQIRAEMVSGNAELDLQNQNDYSEAEAREAFNRVARQHGWL